MKNHKNLQGQMVPDQVTGSQMNAVEKIVLSGEKEAQDMFIVVKGRLLDVNHWSEIAALPMSTFVLVDPSGNPVSRPAEKGDYIRIDIPGPGTKTGDGYDWVIIEDISFELSADTESIYLRARPSANPLANDTHIAHFLTDEATSTFLVKRDGKVISAEEHGRNEKTNTSTANTLDNIRNFFVGLSAKVGVSYPQWKGLVKGLITPGS